MTATNTRRTFFCSHPADKTGRITYNPAVKTKDGVFSIGLYAAFNIVDLSVADRIAFATDLLTLSKDAITPEMADGIYAELGGELVSTARNMKDPEVIHRGAGWTLTFEDVHGDGFHHGFVRLDNVGEAHGAWVHGRSMMDMAKSVIEAFAEDDEEIIAFAQRLIDARTPAADTKIPGGYTALSDQARTVLQYMRRAGSISARDAMSDLDMTSATLSRRICDIEEEGFRVNRERRVHQVTGKRYTRYSLAD